MTLNQPDINRFALAASVRKRWGLFLAEGIILLLLGAAAIIIPPFATLAVAIFLGWLFLVSGIAGLIATFWIKSSPGFWWSLISAVLGIIAGTYLILEPVNGALSLTLVLIVFFIVEGVVSIMYAFDHRRELAGTWSWMLVSGLIDLVLAAIIYTGLPGSAAWALGLLVGINMLFGGVSLIAMALHARRLDPGQN